MIPDQNSVAQPSPVSIDDLPAQAAAALEWARFKARHGAEWAVTLDEGSGVPLLVQGKGIPWFAASGNALASANPGAEPPSLETLAASLRSFATELRGAIKVDPRELSLSVAGSGPVTEELWQVVFDRRIDDAPVVGDRFVFYVGHGNLMAFGASRWLPVAGGSKPRLTPEEARGRLGEFMGLSGAEPVEIVEPGVLEFRAVPAGRSGDARSAAYGIRFVARLTWRIALRVEDGHETWTGIVDANSGEVISFEDANQYAQVKGGVYPYTNNGVCPNGCEQPTYPMPFANFSIGGGPTTTANTMGVFTCSPGGSSATTALAGPYVRVVDGCGTISQSVVCDADLNLGVSAGTDCTVPAGASAGDTHAARTSFYHLNRIKEHARAWLPANSWLVGQLSDNTNVLISCNAFWTGSALNFYKSNATCRNSGEIASIMFHEWGHGLDSNDGGLSDNPSEAYGDITAAVATRESCVATGFLKSGTCSGYGNACLSCTGVRELDWDKRANHVPSTPEGFVATCGSGGGPCAKEVHCEAYLAAETLWDLAARDLPASGIDQATAWQIVDRLWFKSRAGSGGNAYGCGAPAAMRSCGATSWFTKLRTVDDDDGNLANGTPHAAAIFAAFARHNIPCGAAGDAANQSSSSCPSIGAPAPSAAFGPGFVTLSWPAVANAGAYRVLRNDQSCSGSGTIVATVAGTSYTDSGLVNGFPEFYTVQAIGSNEACQGPLSACLSVTPSSSVADLSISVSDSPDPVLAGANVTYSIIVGNSGPLTATSLQLTDTLPAGSTFVSLSASGGWSCSTPPVGGTGTVSCTSASLGSGSGAAFTLVLKTDPCTTSGASTVNVPEIASATPDPVPTNNTASATTLVGNPGCGDGNACTADSCTPGVGCAHAPISCDDANVCTSDGCSPASGCTHANVGGPCDDGNGCTSGDACSGGACSGSPVVPGEVNDSVLLTPLGPSSTISWSDGAGPFNVYRGGRPAASPWSYNQTCLASLVGGPVGDASVPTADELFYYVVSRDGACGESVLARNSGGSAIPNGSPCP